MKVKEQIGLMLVKGITKTFGISQYAKMWLAGADMPDGESAKPTRPYKQVGLVFACVRKLIDSMLGLPLVLSDIDERIIESGAAYDLLFNNPAMSWERFVTEAIGHYSLSSDVFFIFLDSVPAGPGEIMLVSGVQMHPVTHNRRADGELIGWQFRGTAGQRANFGIDEVYQWKNFNPYDRFHGLAPVTAAELDINYSFAAGLYNSSTLVNGAEPGAILTTQGRLDDDQVRMLRSQFDSRHKGAGQAKRTAVLTGGMDVKTVTMKLADLQVAEITNASDKKICTAFGVPPGVVGLITEAQYSHGPAMHDFIFNTVIPLANLFAGVITSGILSKFTASKWLGGSFVPVGLKDAKFYSGPRGLRLSKNSFYRRSLHKALADKKKVFAWFDCNQHPVVQEINRDVAAKVLDFVKAGVPLNDIIEAHDLPYQTTEAGKYWWLGMGQVPADYILEAGLEGIAGPSLPEGEEEEGKSITNHKSQTTNHESQTTKDDARRRLRIWHNCYASWAGIEREYKEAMRLYFLRQQRILLGKLKAALADSKSAVKDADNLIARVVFDLKAENGKLKVINHTFFEKASELGVRQVLTEVAGLSGDDLAKEAGRILQLPAVRRKLLISSLKITDVNITTQEMVAKQLLAGLESGEGLNELVARIKKTLGSNRNRALGIARTQTAGAVGTGRHEAMRSAGVEQKGWVTSGDPQVRDTHKAAGVRYAEPIALDIPFEVGGELLMYPGDPAGSAGNIINCRCLQLARMAAGKSFDLSYYSNIKFYSYTDMQKDNETVKEKQNGT